MNKENKVKDWYIQNPWSGYYGNIYIRSDYNNLLDIYRTFERAHSLAMNFANMTSNKMYNERIYMIYECDEKVYIHIIGLVKTLLGEPEVLSNDDFGELQ